jgi:serine/threonine protein kinase
VPRLIEVCEDARPPYLVLEYTEGRSLRDFVSEAHQLPVPRAVEIAPNLAEVVACRHQHHVYIAAIIAELLLRH